MALAGGYMPSVLAHPWSSRALYLGSASTFSRLMCLPESKWNQLLGLQAQVSAYKSVTKRPQFREGGQYWGCSRIQSRP